MLGVKTETPDWNDNHRRLVTGHSLATLLCATTAVVRRGLYLYLVIKMIIHWTILCTPSTLAATCNCTAWLFSIRQEPWRHQQLGAVIRLLLKRRIVEGCHEIVSSHFTRVFPRPVVTVSGR